MEIEHMKSSIIPKYKINDMVYYIRYNGNPNNKPTLIQSRVESVTVTIEELENNITYKLKSIGGGIKEQNIHATIEKAKEVLVANASLLVFA